MPPPTDDVVDISSEVGEVGKLELSNLTLSEFKSGLSELVCFSAHVGWYPLTPALLLLRSGSKNTVVLVTNDVFLSTELVVV
jgi:hypothetical protein